VLRQITRGAPRRIAVRSIGEREREREREAVMMAKILEGRPAKMGFRMPAEWEPHEQCWMGWPVRTPPSLPCFFPSDLPFFFVLLI